MELQEFGPIAVEDTSLRKSNNTYRPSCQSEEPGFAGIQTANF